VHRPHPRCDRRLLRALGSRTQHDVGGLHPGEDRACRGWSSLLCQQRRVLPNLRMSPEAAELSSHQLHRCARGRSPSAAGGLHVVDGAAEMTMLLHVVEAP